MTIEFWKEKGRWFWQLVGPNGRVMITKQGGHNQDGYARPAFLKKSIDSLSAGFRAAKLKEVTK